MEYIANMHERYGITGKTHDFHASGTEKTQVHAEAVPFAIDLSPEQARLFDEARIKYFQLGGATEKRSDMELELLKHGHAPCDVSDVLGALYGDAKEFSPFIKCAVAVHVAEAFVAFSGITLEQLINGSLKYWPHLPKSAISEYAGSAFKILKKDDLVLPQN